MITTGGTLRRFGDVAVDPDHVLCVSRKMAKVTDEEHKEDEKKSVTMVEDRSTMLIRMDGSVFNVEISESAADDLLFYFFERQKTKAAE